VLLLMPAVAAAQSIVDAQRVEFTPSPDNSALDGNGAAIVTGYTMEIFLAGDTVVQQTVNLGKPALDTDGMIRLNYVSLLATPLTPGVVYEAVVQAVGPGGSADSARSNTFSFSLPCAPTISPISQTVSGAGGSGSTTVTAAAGCAWTAVSNAAWITISAGSSGTGNGTVSFNVGANTSSSSRSGTLTIAGSTFTVNQSAPCTFTVSPLALTPGSSGATGTLSVTTQGGCPWTASSSATWATVNGSGSGSGTASYTIAGNTLTTQRTATFTVAGKTVAITEAALATKPRAPTNLRIIR